jgi:putative peptide zinc metalloprotease protein
MNRPQALTEDVRAKPFAPRMRADLAVIRRSTMGPDRWLIKDPISLRYFELSDEEYAVLTMLDGTATLVQIKDAIEKRFPPRLATFDQLQNLVHRFFTFGLVYGEGGIQLAASQNASEIRRKWLGQLVNPLFIKFPGIDPERALQSLYPCVRWMFGPIPLLSCLVLIAIAATIVAMEFAAISHALPSLEQLFQANNLIWMVAALAVSKSLHELGHALTCKHYGGECHEIGLALLVFTPSLYCDTTDAWVIPNKWKRAAVGAAGMAIELVLAAVCVIAWRFSQPGLIHFLCLNVVFVCSVSTLLFNGNPLLRFDGYYILSDLVDIPNLWHRSRSALLELLQRWLLGLRPPAGIKSSRGTFLLIVYAIASLAYRWVIGIAIIVLLYKFLRPYGLQLVGNTLLMLTLAGMFGVPIWRSVQFLRRPGIWRRMHLVRAFLLCVLGIALVAAVLVIPIPHYVTAPLVLELRDAESIYVSVPGILDAVYLQPGDRVAADAPIAKLSNLEIDQEIARLSGERDRLQIHLQNLSRRQGRDKDAADAIPATRTALAELDERLRRRRRDAQRLQLVALRAGVVSPPPRISPTLPEEDLPTWSGMPCDDHNLGCYLEVGTLVCLVGDPSAVDALLIVDQNDIEFVRPGQAVEIMLNEYRRQTTVGKVAQIAQIDLEKVPLVLSHKSGGEVSTVSDESGGERPIRIAYQARVPLPDTELSLLPGFSGRAKIDVGREPLGRRIMRLFRQTFLF